jgi:hypothetical protein
MRVAPSATFVRHSPGAATRRNGADNTPAHNHEPEVAPRRRHQLLDERAVLHVPRLVADSLERRLELLLGLASHDVTPPAPVARLEDDRWGERVERPITLDVATGGLRDTGPAEESRGEELVVGGEQRARVVQHRNAARGEDPQSPEPVLDAVERRPHVEPSERGISRCERAGGLNRRHRDELEPPYARPGEREGRRAGYA